MNDCFRMRLISQDGNRNIPFDFAEVYLARRIRNSKPQYEVIVRTFGTERTERVAMYSQLLSGQQAMQNMQDAYHLGYIEFRFPSDTEASDESV